MKFGYTILYVENVAATIGFYERAFGFAKKMLHQGDDGNDYGELDTGATTLSFASRKFASTHISLPLQQGGVGNDPPAAEIAFVTDDVPGAFQTAVAAGAVHVSDPANKPWGQMVSYVRDNNGFIVEICSPVG